MIKSFDIFRLVYSDTNSRVRRACYSLILYYFFIHALLAIWDYHHPDVFMSADRASTRMISIEKLLSAASSSSDIFSQTLSNHGIIGDYLFHAILFAFGGKALIISGQLFLGIVSIIFIFLLTLVLTKRKDMSVAAALIYLHLPYSLIYPHVLCSEAIFSPLIILSLGTLAFFKMTNDNIWMLCLSALLIGTSALIRPIALLWPIVIISVGLIFNQLKYGYSLFYLIFAFTPMLFWVVIMQIVSGDISMGRSGHDLNHNLYGRVKYISRTLSKKESDSIRKNILETRKHPNELTMTGYISFVVKYPFASAKHYLNDLIAFTAKSGVEAIIFDYLQLESEFRKTLRDGNTSWRRSMDKNGIFYVINEMFWNKPSVIMATIVGTVSLLSLWFLYIYGIWRTIKVRSNLNPFLSYLFVLLALLPPYVFATSTLCMNIQSRHRSPVEFCIVILGTVGLFALTDRLKLQKNDAGK